MVTTATGNTGTVETTGRGAASDSAAVRRGGRGAPGPNGKGGPGGGGGSGGGSGDEPRKWSPDRYRIGVFVGLASILMMFTALASAYIVRSGLPGSVDWRGMSVPPFVWVSTALIVLSSLTISRAQKALRRADEGAYLRWLGGTLVLGMGFVASQLLAWRQLVAEGVYMRSNPHSSFFYVLTGLHGLHLLGGIAGLSYLLFFARAARSRAEAVFDAKRRTLTDVVTIYWHFMDGLWVFLFLLLFLWR
ncbi:MAG TPA: cytochrome c oxidase subunit 3 [Pyrinomonadaceae bacterium]|nr:cytochrome c oxidase subunit 3 [Pyrinomonadaceae bacterium]